MVRAAFVIACVLLAIFGESLIAKPPSDVNFTHCFQNCKENYLNDCKNKTAPYAVICNDVNGWCQSDCDHLVKTMPTESNDIEQENQEVFGKRELDKLKELFGI